MKKIDFKILIVTMLICLIPIVIGIIMYDKLPEQMAVHFNINNEPNSYTSKEFAVFGIPTILALLQAICCIFSDLLESEQQNKKFMTIYKWIIPIIGIMVNLSIIAFSIGIKLNIQIIACITIGIIFAIMGNYLPKAEPNKFKIGYLNRESWKKLNRPMAYFFVIIGLLFIISAFLNPMFSIILLGLIIVATLIMLIYMMYLNYKIKSE